MINIHWLGAGLSSIPGIRRLARKKIPLTVWNRNLEKAKKSIDHVSSSWIQAKEYNLSELESSIKSGDILVSQLPANMHYDIANICIKNKCHFASTSYLSKEINSFDTSAKKNKLVFINEVGLDPGIDHFFSHLLVQNLEKNGFEDIDVSYKSYCGGIPALPNKFKYKFSWSPVGVIKALNNKAIYIDNYKKQSVTPYKNIKNFNINNEIFEAYPNRNSIPYIDEYMFPKKWKIKEFVRGTLRLNGWSDAWKEIFIMLDNNSANLDQQINEKSLDLLNLYKYKENEEDRVVLWVNLEASKNNKKIWNQTFHLDEKGKGENTAMAKLVSLTLSAAIDLILDNKIHSGVQAAPSNKKNIDYFFEILKEHSIQIKYNNH